MARPADRVFGVADGLRLAAAPTFVLMALLAASSGGGAMAGLCSSAHGLGPGGMTTMYLLMGAFHAPPWLNLGLTRLSNRRGLNPPTPSAPGPRSPAI